MGMLERISMSLTEPVSCILIGGLAMMHHGTKEATKDIDIVFNTEDEILHFIETIRRMDFKKIDDLTDEYLDLKAHAIFYSDDGYMMDLFLLRVLDGFYLTDNMIERSRDLHLKGNLSLSVLSPVDIFLFKSITLREGDLMDMAYLSPMIYDWDPFREEIIFIQHAYEIVARSYRRLDDLYNEYQINVPVRTWMSDIGEMATAKTVILSAIQNESKEREYIMEGTNEVERQLLDDAINELTFDGIIWDKDGKVSMKFYPSK
jgi:hypothetical protein